MRLIDADAVTKNFKNSFVINMSKLGELSIGCTAPTVPAVPLSVIEDIKAEIECRRNEIKEVDEKSKTISMKGYVLGLDRALEIIDKAVKEFDRNEK